MTEYNQYILLSSEGVIRDTTLSALYEWSKHEETNAWLLVCLSREIV